jgi:hypothetical protein
VRAASCVFFLGVYFLFFRSLQWFFERSAPPAVLTVRWLDVFPELAPVMRELAVCAAEIRERFPLVSAPDVYACDAEGGPFGPACAAEAAGHLRAIEEPSERVIAAYRRRDQERRAARRAARGCQQDRRELPFPQRVAARGANITATVLDARPCGAGPDRFLVRLAGAPGAHDDLTGDGVFAQGGGMAARLRLDHLARGARLADHALARAPGAARAAPRAARPGGQDGRGEAEAEAGAAQGGARGGSSAGRGGGGAAARWVSGGPCARRVQEAVAEVGRARPELLSHAAPMALRGVFWYPPGGFDAWHTDTALLQGRTEDARLVPLQRHATPRHAAPPRAAAPPRRRAAAPPRRRAALKGVRRTLLGRVAAVPGGRRGARRVLGGRAGGVLLRVPPPCGVAPGPARPCAARAVRRRAERAGGAGSRGAW